MESFSIVKRGYDPHEVDSYIERLEQIIKSYKDKDNSINNAIVSAQVAADNILKNAHLEITEIRAHQRGTLIDLHTLKKGEIAKGNSVEATDTLILKLESKMIEEDVNWVMARVAKLP